MRSPVQPHLGVERNLISATNQTELLTTFVVGRPVVLTRVGFVGPCSVFSAWSTWHFKARNFGTCPVCIAELTLRDVFAAVSFTRLDRRARIQLERAHFGVFSTSRFVPPTLSSDWTWPTLSSVICHWRGGSNWLEVMIFRYWRGIPTWKFSKYSSILVPWPIPETKHMVRCFCSVNKIIWDEYSTGHQTIILGL